MPYGYSLALKTNRHRLYFYFQFNDKTKSIVMKKLVLFSMALMVPMSSLFGQIKYLPKVIVLFYGEKNPTFDESKYPDLKFYYLPDIKVESSGKTSGKTASRAFGSIMGVGNQASKESSAPLSGSPEQLVKLGVMTNDAFLFDKNGVFTGTYWGDFKSGISERKFDNFPFLVSGKKKTMVTDGNPYETGKYADLAKDHFKKGKTTSSKINNGKPKKKDNPDSYRFLYGKKWPDFNVQDAEGNEHSFGELVSGAPLTMVYGLFLDKDFNFNKGEESGKDKSGKQYANDVMGSMAAQKQVQVFSDIESQVFGHKVK